MFRLTPWAARKVPVRHEEEHPVYSLQRDMNRLFDDFLKGSPWESIFDSAAVSREFGLSEITPRIDMSETEKELIVKAELPGMTDKEVEISISRDLLTISGEKKQEKEQSEKGWYRMERQYGSFSRSIPLPYEIESDKAEALYQHGVLSIRLPKAAAQLKSTKTIQVKTK